MSLESKYEEDPIDVQEWAEQSDEDIPYEQDDTQMLAARILPGQEDRQHWQAEGAYGLMSTTAEGPLGKTLKRLARASRTDEEKFRDSLIKVSRDAEIPTTVRDSILRLIPRIPDVGYKSAAGVIFGYLSMNYIGRKLNTTERKEMDKILEKIQTVKEKELRISSLDCVRYGRLMKRILNPSSI